MMKMSSPPSQVHSANDFRQISGWPAGCAEDFKMFNVNWSKFYDFCQDIQVQYFYTEMFIQRATGVLAIQHKCLSCHDKTPGGAGVLCAGGAAHSVTESLPAGFTPVADASERIE